MLKSTGFYDFAWNPIEGCLHGCDYCYAKIDIERRGKSFDPKFYEERLEEPFKVKSSRIFCTHYTDMMGEFIPKSWIESVLNVIHLLPEHTFIFITKNPSRYYSFDFPQNCILGVTVESPDKWIRAEEMIVSKNRKMCSIEPMLGSFEGKDFSQFELIVIGALMGAKSHICSQWVNSVKHNNIYYKRNVKQYLK